MILTEDHNTLLKEKIVEKDQAKSIVYYTQKINSFNVIHNIIVDCWMYDNPIIDKWHIKAGSGFRECVRDSMDTLINDTNETFEFEVFIDKTNNAIIGFFASELIEYYDYKDIYHLTTFFVKPEYRNREFMTAYCNDMSNNIAERTKDGVSSFWLSTIWAKNTRVIEWFKKLQGKALDRVKMPKGDVVIFGFGYK